MSSKKEVLTMITSFTQGNRLDYAEKIYEIMESHFKPKKAKEGKVWRGEYGEFNVEKRPRQKPPVKEGETGK